MTKGQLISKRLLEKIVWTKIATKKFDNFCPGGQIRKMKTLSYINYGVLNSKSLPDSIETTRGAESSGAAATSCNELKNLPM